MRRTQWLVSMAVAGIVCVGCSSGGTTTAKAASSSTLPTTVPSGATGGQPSATTNPPSFSGSGSSHYCNLARQVQTSSRINPTGDLRASFQQFDKVANQFLSAVPSAIKADAQTLVRALRQFEGVLRAANYDITKMNTADLQSLQDPNFSAAANRITAYDKQVCGLPG